MTDSSIKKPRFKGHLTLFWRLFLSLLFMILITSTLSIVVERWLNEQELATRMDSQIEKLLAKRELLVVALQAGDMDAVKQMYDDDRRLMNQIRIYDEQGSIIYPRYRYRQGRGEEVQPTNRQERALSGSRDFDSNSSDNNSSDNNGFDKKGFDKNESDYSKFGNKQRSSKNPYDNYSLSGYNSKEEDSSDKSILNDILQPMPPHKAIADVDSRPELAEVLVVMPNEQTAIIQLRPHLIFKDVLELQRGNFTVRLGLIILFSVLVCFWLSRTMTQRILRVQHTIHRMLVGDYQANPNLSNLGGDELGLLAKDVAQLSERLTDSELARKQMLNDISHELRSPLARLDVATELTRDFAPNTSRYLDRIDKESARMNELIEQIIRIQSLQMQQYTISDLESESVNISEIITEIGQDVCFEFQHKHVHWVWQPPTSVYLVRGNQDQLHSAFENVIRNAFMHTPPNSTVTATILMIRIDKATEGIQISITDEGGGVEEKDLERIFQPFVRLDSARHRQTGGYGLGLAIVHAVVMAHKGQLNVHNKQANVQDSIQGLVVQIILPVK
ncbi:sensor histidine kinase [Psychrobacter urativorans]|uniref:sensor histidine kinase n=1 Tax=Psychrobacter urativorans TaxID=45610 RepID=UPI00191AD921|nr:ATP-binding protein [Psychrobacter urativorans]